MQMVEGRQVNEWNQTLALIDRVSHLMGKWNVRPYLPGHLLRVRVREKPQDEAEIKMNWSLFKAVFTGRIRQG